MSTKTDRKKPFLGISTGDLNGIGPEVIIKSLKDNALQKYCVPIIYASAPTMIYHINALGLKNFKFNQIDSPENADPKQVNLIDVFDGEINIDFGQVTKNGGQAAMNSFYSAAKDLKEEKIDALVTAPVSKKSMQMAGHKFPGHTEYLGELYESDQYLMMMVGERMKIATVSGHTPLFKVPNVVTKKKVLKALKILNSSLIEDFGIIRPKIAVLGLNPHAGEDGMLGTEEQDNIQPAMDEAERQDILAFGPFPADGFFGTMDHLNYDAVLAMYHDQGLIPFKLQEFHTGVNYTAGLPGVRTSPDHGTGFAIAGQKKANPSSFIEAVFTALNILKKRAEFEEINANPLEANTEVQKER